MFHVKRVIIIDKLHYNAPRGAPTERGKHMSIRATVKSPLNTFPQYSSGEGGTQAEQIAELQTKLLLVVGTLQKVTESTKLLNTDYPLGFAPGQDFAVGHINMSRAGTGEEPAIVVANVEIKYMSTSFLIANTNKINTTGNAVADFIAAYRDAAGVGGYAANANAPSYYDLNG